MCEPIAHTVNATTVAIIGGGWCGLIATKYLKETGMACTCYEASSSIGGIWKQARKFGSIASSSKSYMHASDFLFSHKAKMFPSADEVMDHIEEYAKHFDLMPLIRFNSRINSVEFDETNEKWVLEVSLGKNGCDKVLARYDKLVISTGLCGSPSIPDEAHRTFSTIPNIHSSELAKRNTPTWCKEDGTDARVLVVGGGESATDVATVMARECDQLVLSLRTGRWFFPKLKPPRKVIPADLMSRRTYKLLSYGAFQRFFDRYVVKLSGKGAHNTDAWAPAPGITSWGCFLNKRSDQILPLVEQGKILPVAGIKNSIVSKDGATVDVEFDCGKSYKIKGVIWCTGYKRVALVPDCLAVPPEHSLLHIFPGGNPSTYGKIAYIGAARPNLGSIPSLAEYGSLWVSKVFSGQCSLPSFTSVPDLIEKQTLDRIERFPQDGKKIGVLVYSVEYTDSILRQMGMKFPIPLLPPINLFWTYPISKAFAAYKTLCSAPWSPLELSLLFNSKGKGLETLKSIRQFHSEKKAKDSNFFLKDLVKDAIVDMQVALTMSLRVAILVIAFGFLCISMKTTL